MRTQMVKIDKDVYELTAVTCDVSGAISIELLSNMAPLIIAFMEGDIELVNRELRTSVNADKLMRMLTELINPNILTVNNELINKINIIFTDDENDGICLSTIHKAKGLEADNVYILCESLMPSKHAKKEWEKISENNLKYVAVTRAKKTLNFICEKQFSPNLFNNRSIIDELEIKRITINKINKININSLTNVDYKKNISNDVKQIMNINNYNNKSINKQKIGANKFSKFI